MGTDPKLKFTLGVHPHLITLENCESLFQKLVGKPEEFPEALGIDEVGLDHTTTCRCNKMHDKARCIESKKEAQRQFLRLCFQFAKQLDKVMSGMNVLGKQLKSVCLSWKNARFKMLGFIVTVL